MIRRAAFLAISLLVLTSCARITLVKPETQDIGGAFTVEPQVSWNQWTSGSWQLLIPPKAVAWTANGMFLDAIILYPGLAEGERIFLAPGQEDFPVFDPEMRATDVAEFVTASFSGINYADVKTESLRPAQFGSLKGFRFEFSMTSESGLEYEGMAIGALVDGKLHLILYRGARLHYFPEYKDEVERIFGSVVQKT